MRIDCKDKELWGNVLVTIEWLVDPVIKSV